MIKFRVKLHGFVEGEAELRSMKRRFRPVVSKHLKKFGDEQVAWLKLKVLTGGLGLPPKRRHDGKPPLFDSGKYINGYVADVEGMKLQILATGRNDHMLNEDLAELLEFGFTTKEGIYHAPLPHIRPMLVHMESQIPKLGKEIADELFGSR